MNAIIDNYFFDMAIIENLQITFPRKHNRNNL